MFAVAHSFNHPLNFITSVSSFPLSQANFLSISRLVLTLYYIIIIIIISNYFISFSLRMWLTWIVCLNLLLRSINHWPLTPQLSWFHLFTYSIWLICSLTFWYERDVSFCNWIQSAHFIHWHFCKVFFSFSHFHTNDYVCFIVRALRICDQCFRTRVNSINRSTLTPQWVNLDYAYSSLSRLTFICFRVWSIWFLCLQWLNRSIKSKSYS